MSSRVFVVRLRRLAHGVSLTASKEAAELFATGAGASASNAINIVDENSVEVDIEDLDADKMLEVNSAIAVEKEIAADTIGTIFAATGMHFLDYVEQCTLELVTLLPHYYEGIRKSATDSLLEIIRTFYKLSEPTDWVPGREVVSVFEKCCVLGIVLIVGVEGSSSPEGQGPHQPCSSAAVGHVRDRG